MEAHVLLADAAQSTQEGKVNALGMGWSTTTTPLPGHAVVIFLKVPWGETNIEHPIHLELVDDDGRAVTVPGPVGEQPIKLEGQFEAGRPAGVKQGTPIDMAMTFALAPGLPLTPGRYTWVLRIDDEPKDDWRASFTVKAGQKARAKGGQGEK